MYIFACVHYRAALLAGHSRLLVARLCRLRVLLWYCKQPESMKVPQTVLQTHHATSSQNNILTSFASLSGESSRQLTLHLLEKQCENKTGRLDYVIFIRRYWIYLIFKHTDRGCEPLESFHLENLTADVPVAFRVLLCPMKTQRALSALYSEPTLSGGNLSSLAAPFTPPGIQREELQPADTKLLLSWMFWPEDLNICSIFSLDMNYREANFLFSLILWSNNLKCHWKRFKCCFSVGAHQHQPEAWTQNHFI